MELVACRFKLVTHELELVTRGFDLVTSGLELITCRSEFSCMPKLVTRVLLYLTGSYIVGWLLKGYLVVQTIITSNQHSSFYKFILQGIVSFEYRYLPCFCGKRVYYYYLSHFGPVSQYFFTERFVCSQWYLGSCTLWVGVPQY